METDKVRKRDKEARKERNNRRAKGEERGSYSFAFKRLSYGSVLH